MLYKSWIWPRDLGLGICNIAEWMHTMDKLILARFLKNVKLKPTKQSWYYERWQEILFIAKIVVHLFLRLPWINEWCRKFPLLLGIHYLQNSCDVWNSYLFFVVFALEGKYYANDVRLSHYDPLYKENMIKRFVLQFF